MTEPSDSELNLSFPAAPEELKNVREQVQAFTDRLGCSGTISAELVLAVNEACMNIMQHAYQGDREGQIELCVQYRDDELVFTLRDFAEPCDTSTIRPRRLDDLRPGGLGTHFINTIMDDCCYGRLEGRRGNYVRMTRKIGVGGEQ